MSSEAMKTMGLYICSVCGETSSNPHNCACQYIHKADLRKLVERIKDKADDAYADMEHRRYAAYRECADELEAVLDKKTY